LGVAREVSAQFHVPLKDIALKPEESDDPIEKHIKVSIDDPAGCPRYMGRLVRGVTIGESPQWLKNRLSALGVRPISNVVDVTNYILLLFGQPMHAFDYATIGGREIIVRRAQKGQKFVTLDDIERKLIADDLLICDGEQATALAGVMGGAGSEITGDTTDVFLECAYFNPVGIRKTSKRLDLSSDSSYRFERGVDPEAGCVQALDTAAEMIRQLAGGTVATGVIDEYPNPIPKKQIPLITSHVSRLLGLSLPKETIIQSLASLQIELISEDKEKLVFAAPQFRHDLQLEVDLIEEVGRLYGYDKIPVSMNALVPMDKKVNHVESITNTIRTSLAAVGLHETVTNSMTSEEKCALLTPETEAVVLINPLNPDMSRMRTTILGSLLDVTAYNLNRKNSNNRFFEIGKKYISRGANKQPSEPDILAILIEGDYCPASWNSKKQKLDFYILKGILKSLCMSLSIPAFKYSFIKEKDRTIFDTESASISGSSIKGVCGKLKENILQFFTIKTPVYYAELDISDLLKNGVEQSYYSPLPRYPAVERDFCFVMQEDLLSSAVTDEIYGLSELVESVTPFDVYRGEKLPAGMKSIAFSVYLRAEDRTLTDKEAEKLCNKIIATMKSKYKATLRAE
jgi:phenylalanyl-tRNA synthetase beta chain